MSDPKEFGKSLKGIRKERGLTLLDLGNRAGFTKSYLSIIENGKQGIPKPETIKKLAKGLDYSYIDLMGMAGYLNKNENSTKGFGEYVKELREKAGKSIEEVGKESGLGSGYIQRIENNQTFEPSKKQLQKLGEALGIDDLYIWFFENTNYHLYGGDLLEAFAKEATTINQKDFTVSLPTHLEIRDKNGVTHTYATTLKHLFDLFYLLNMNVDLHYKDKLLTDNDKQKIKTMLQTLLE